MIHHIHFYVPDAMASQAWFCHVIGMTMLRRVELKDHITCLVGYRESWFLFSSPTSPHSPIARHLRSHAPGVIDVALEVEDLTAVLERDGQDRQAGSAPPAELAGLEELLEGSAAKLWGRVRGWGSVRHTLVQRSPQAGRSVSPPAAIDHVVLNVPAGELDAAVGHYGHLFRFERQQTFRIGTVHSGLRSQVLRASGGGFYFNINEPACPSSQIQQFLHVNRGAGIQHLALRAEPLLATVSRLRRQGMPFLPAPEAYQRRLQQRLGLGPAPALSVQELQALGESQILADWQPDQPRSLLLQIFSLPIFPGSLFFLEFIERRGSSAVGFGEGNFLSLYEAVEAELESR